MHNFESIKRTRRIKRGAIILTSVGSIGILFLSFVALLKNSLGTFTVNLANQGVALAIDTHSAFDNPTTYLHVEDFGVISGPQSYLWFETHDEINFSQIHNENTPFDLGTSDTERGLRFFKYTFFVKNVGTIPAKYDFDVKIVEQIHPENSFSLDEYLRLMVFEGEEKTVYARRSLTKEAVDVDSQDLVKEDVCGPEGSPKYRGEAELFLSDTLLARRSNLLKPEEMIMYTVLFWLEGDDPECQTVPDNASLKLGVTINANSDE